ncbi:MAG: LysR family transcriptional regulator [Clostridia bacterium]|nr:LysR family transcriptional regulator [Clostridia bacterium]
MTLKQYRAFIYSVESGSLSLAAKKLGATQSGLTHLIINMEEELGFSLMVRNKAGVKLTDEGRRIFPSIKAVVDADNKASELASKIRGEKSSQITIATFSSVAVNWLPSIINGYKNLYPETQFSIIDGGYAEIEEALETGACDLAFLSLPISLNVKTIPLVKDEMFAVVPATHPLANKPSVDISEFEKESVICLNENTDHDSRYVFKKHGVTPNVKYRTGDDYAMVSMVENNLGICLEPEMILNSRVVRAKVLPLSPREYRTVALCVPYESHKNENMVRFSNYILSWIKQNAKQHLL